MDGRLEDFFLEFLPQVCPDILSDTCIFGVWR